MKFYRYEDITTHKGVEVELYEYVLFSETPQGYWVTPEYFKKRYENIKDVPRKCKHWVKKHSVKKYAYLTQKEALLGFYHRKRMQENHCKYFGNRAATAKLIASSILKKEYQTEI